MLKRGARQATTLIIMFMVFFSDSVNNVLYVAGHFDNSGATPIHRVGKWDGTSWSALGNGMDQDVYTVTMYNGELYAGGHFTIADGNNCNYIAKWDGSTWQPVGTGMDKDVYYLHVYNGELYAAGIFTTADGNPASRIAKWDGTNWSAVGTGVSGTTTPQIYSMQVYNNELYVTGQFADAGGTSVNNIAKWNGTSWIDVGGGLSGAIEYGSDLIIYNNNLVVTGSFLTAGNDTVNGIAKWNGTSWSGFGIGLNLSGDYGAVLGVYNGELYVGGSFTSVDGVSANRIARYNEITLWKNLGVGCDQEVDALEIYNGELFVGGTFFNGGGVGLYKVGKWSSGCTTVARTSGQNISCFGACDGSVSVTNAGNAPFTYLWSSGNTTNAVSGFCPGSYTVTVTDSSGCTAVDSIAIVEFPLASLTLTAISPICNGQCNGSAVITASGRAPFAYSWSTNPLQISDTAIGLCAGLYFVNVTDSAGCTVTDSVVVSDPVPFALSFAVTAPVCPLSCNGIAAVNSTSPNTPFTYAWNTSPVQNTDTATALCEGIYTVTITDSLGCVTEDSIAISDPILLLNTSSTNATCNGNGCDGLATAIASGPTAFTYLWSTTETTNSISNLCTGNYSVTATDSAGCTLTDFVTIVVNTFPSLTLNATLPLCFGDCNGSILANASATSPLTYLWSTSETTSTITNVCLGWYSLTVTDSLGCASNDSVLVLQPDPVDITVTSSTNITCNADCDGSINSFASGGTLPYNYLWSNNNSFPDLFNVCADTYTLTVTDSHNCTKQAVVTLSQPDSLIVTLTSTDATCQGCNDGALISSVSGGTAPYNYFYTPVVADLNHVTAGTYFLCVQDSHGCQTCDSTVVSEPNGIFEIADSQIQLSVYPNPFSLTTTVNIPASIKNTDKLKISVYDLLGREINNFSYHINKTNNQQLIIMRETLNAGIYMFKVSSTEKNIGTGRFIVE